MTRDDEQQFYNAEMPGWYRKAAWALRGLGFLATLGGLLVFVYVSQLQSPGGLYCFFVGLALLILPSIPRAAIEQRNRHRGLKDGTLLADLNKKDES